MSKSLSKRSGLNFPVGRIHKILRHGNFAPRVGVGAAVYLAAALEYLAAEILELAINVTSNNLRIRITPRFILLAVKSDHELDEMLRDTVIAQGGVLPKVQRQLLSKKNTNESNTTKDDTMSQEY